MLDRLAWLRWLGWRFYSPLINRIVFVHTNFTIQQTAVSKQFAFLLSCFGLIAILFLAGFNLNDYLSKPKVLGAETPNFSKEMVFWENIVSENPTYIDGWVELARASYELGDKDYAIGALNSAKAINPNSEKIEVLEKELGLLGP